MFLCSVIMKGKRMNHVNREIVVHYDTHIDNIRGVDGLLPVDKRCPNMT